MKAISLSCVVLLLSLTLSTIGQETKNRTAPSELSDLQNLTISTDGAWLATEEHPEEGDEVVRVWSTKHNTTFSIERGQNPQISRDSRWVSALQKPLIEDSTIAEPKSLRAGQTLVLLDLQNGSRTTFDFVLSYDMTFSSTYLLYLQSLEPKAQEGASKPATNKRKVGTLHQIPLNRARLVRIGHQQPDWKGTKENVAQFVTHPRNDHFAYVFHNEETDGYTVHIVKWCIRSFVHGTMAAWPKVYAGPVEPTAMNRSRWGSSTA